MPIIAAVSVTQIEHLVNKDVQTVFIELKSCPSILGNQNEGHAIEKCFSSVARFKTATIERAVRLLLGITPQKDEYEIEIYALDRYLFNVPGKLCGCQPDEAILPAKQAQTLWPFKIDASGSIRFSDAGFFISPYNPSPNSLKEFVYCRSHYSRRTKNR